jgi:hypothetical protein
MKKRPFGVTLLAILAGLGAVAAVIHTLQFLHLFPISWGPVKFFTFDFLGALMWGLMAAIYIWLVIRLWNVDAQAWLFLVALASLNLILDVISIIGASSWQAMLPSIVVAGVVLIYCLLPGTKEAFGTA